MPKEPRDVVSRFVRWKLNHLVTETSQKDLAKRLRLSPAGLSNVRAGKSGVGSRSRAKYARVLGYGNAEALETAAMEWALSEAKVGTTLAQEPAVLEALRIVGSMTGRDDTSLRMVLHAFGNDRFRGRPTEYWVRTLLDELRYES